MSLLPEQKTVIFFVVWASITTLSAIDIYLPSLPAIGVYFDAPESTIKMAIPLFLLGSLLSSFFIGFLSDHYGRKPVMLGAMALFIVGGFLCAAASVLPVFFAGRFIQGIGAAASPVLGWTMIHDALKGRQSMKVLSVIGSIVSLAPLFSPLVGGFVHMAWGWRGTFWILTVLGVVTFLMLKMKVPETLDVGRRQGISFQTLLTNYAMILKNPVFFAYISLFALAISAEWCFLSMSPFYFEDVLGISTHHFGILIGLMAGLYCVTLMALPKITARMGEGVALKAAPIFTFLGAALFLLTYFFAPRNPYCIVGSMAIFLIGAAFGWLISVSTGLGLFPNQKGVASSVRGLTIMGSMALGGLLGRVIPAGSLLPTAISLMIFAIAITVIGVWLIRLEKRTQLNYTDQIAA